MWMTRIRKMFEKNQDEIHGILLRKYPEFILKKDGQKIEEIPVFVFHEVIPERLESQLKYLRDNGYRTLDADELSDAIRQGRSDRGEVALTFDDATWTFWTFAFPLLRKYGHKAILFAIPSIVPDDQTVYPSLQDEWDGFVSREELNKRRRIQPLCTWRELVAMHESGQVDVQSHSLTHSRIPTSPEIVDFLNPQSDTDFYGNVNIPLSWTDDPFKPRRPMSLGAPVYCSLPRLACKPRYLEDPDLTKHLTDYVERQGGERFFDRPAWRRELLNQTKGLRAPRAHRFESEAEMISAVRLEFGESKNVLEKNLKGKKIRHFCYPWFSGGDRADHFCAEAGYHSVHYGLGRKKQGGPSSDGLIRIHRIIEDYIHRLPGENRQSLRAIWLSRLARLRNGKH